MNTKHELRLTGAGGQGVILETIILAEAATIAGKNVVQSQVYGPEARGGICKAEVIISDDEILFPKVQNPSLLLSLTQESLDKFSQSVDDDCVVVVDDSLEIPKTLDNVLYFSLPILKTARDVVKKNFTANIVSIGAINKLIELVSEDSLKSSVLQNIPKGTESINLLALEEGSKLISNDMLERLKSRKCG